MCRGEYAQPQLGQGEATLDHDHTDDVGANQAFNVHVVVDVEGGDEHEASSVHAASTSVLLETSQDDDIFEDDIFVFDEPVPRSWGHSTDTPQDEGQIDWTPHAIEDFLALYAPQDDAMYAPADEPRSMPSLLRIERWLAEAGGDAPFHNMQNYTTRELSRLTRLHDGEEDEESVGGLQGYPIIDAYEAREPGYYEDLDDDMSENDSLLDTEWSWEIIY